MKLGIIRPEDNVLREIWKSLDSDARAFMLQEGDVAIDPKTDLPVVRGDLLARTLRDIDQATRDVERALAVRA